MIAMVSVIAVTTLNLSNIRIYGYENSYGPVTELKSNGTIVYENETEDDDYSGEYKDVKKSSLENDVDGNGVPYVYVELEYPKSFKKPSDMTNYVKEVYKFYAKKYDLEKYVNASTNSGPYLSFFAGDYDDGYPLFNAMRYDSDTKLTVYKSDGTIESSTAFTFPSLDGTEVDDSNDGKTTKEILQEKLSAAAAWVAFSEYGKEMYPYGFKLHYIREKIGEEAYDENTWSLKAKATITNAFGAKYDTVVEAKVTGTEDYPRVYDFYAYE